MGHPGFFRQFLQGLLLAAMTVDGGYADRGAALTSSHFASSERQYRFPLGYGGQRTPTAQWTVTGSGSALVTNQGTGPRITAATVGTVRDLGIKDPGNMGAAMAPVNVKLRPYQIKWLAWFYLYTQNTNNYGGNTSNYIYNHTIIFIFRGIYKSNRMKKSTRLGAFFIYTLMKGATHYPSQIP